MVEVFFEGSLNLGEGALDLVFFGVVGVVSLEDAHARGFLLDGKCESLDDQKSVGFEGGHGHGTSSINGFTRGLKRKACRVA